MKTVVRILMITVGVILISYIAFWLYVRYGGEDVRSIKPQAWILPDPGTDLRSGPNLEGPGNFRTLGSIRIDSINKVRPELIFRSDSPSKYTKEDWIKLEKLGVGLIIDLRSDKETIDDAYITPENIKYVHNPIYRDDPMRDAFRNLLFERQRLPQLMEEGYLNMIQTRAENFGRVVTLISEHLDKGIVFHCTAGKDRTGILSAILLGITGVDRETIVYDYALSNYGFESNYKAFLEKSSTDLLRFGIPPQEMEVIFAVDPRWIEKTLDLIDKEYGGIELFLLNEAGVKREVLERLKAHLIVEESVTDPM